MGKINEYQRQKLASSAVGVVPPDQSGKVIGGSISNLGAAISKKEREMDTYAEMQANTAVMQFGLAFQKFGAQAQREMAANPTKYPERIFAGGQELLMEFAEGIQDTATREKFVTSANTILKSGVLQATGWADAKMRDNATIAAKDAIRLGAIAIGETTTKDELVQGINTVQEMTKNEIPDSVLGAKDKQTAVDKLMPATLDSHFSNRIRQDADALIKDLESGEYKDVPYYTDDMKNTYIKQAETHIRQEKTRVKTAQTLNFADAGEAFLADQLTFSMIDVLASAEKEEDGISPTQALLLKKSLVLQAENRASDLSENNNEAAKYIKVVKDVVKNRVDRAEVLTQIIDAYAMGFASREESQFFTQTWREIETVKGQQAAQEWGKSVDYIEKRAQQIWGKETTTAQYIREFVGGMATGVPAHTVARAVLRKMSNAKVIEDNPNLAAAEDPTDAAYERAAMKLLTDNGYPTDKANVEALKKQLADEDNRKME